MIRDAAAGPDAGLSSIPASTSCTWTTSPRAICSRWSAGRIGERYILGGENLLLKDILALVAEVVGRRPPRIELPEALRLAGRAG